jgi:hypothetical protein
MAINLTNKHGLPDTFVKACMIDNHVTRGDISVTQLIDAPQIRYLRKTNDYDEDVMNRIWALMGTAMHHVLELSEIKYTEARQLMEAYGVAIQHENKTLANQILEFCKDKYPNFENPDVMLEKTLSIEVDGMVISGTMDKFIIPEKALEDYKNCSTYMYTNPEARKKWEPQQNIYAYMLRQHGYTVDSATIVAVFGMLRNKDYPKHPIARIPIDLYDDKTMEKYLKKRVQLHRMAEEGNVLECTPKERWHTPDKFAITEKGRKRAIRVLDSEQAVEEWMNANSFKYDEKNLKVEYRPGTDNRCENFCSLSSVCPQFKRIQEQKSNETSID